MAGLSRGPVTISFGPFTLDVGTRQLLRDGHCVHLSPKAFELLVALVDVRPRVLSKAELQERLWPDTFVAEANLSNLIAEIRGAVGDRARAPRCDPHGARLRLRVLRPDDDRAGTGRRPRPAHRSAALAWGQQRFQLGVGEHIIGRDEHADVRLECLNGVTPSRAADCRPTQRPCWKISAARTARFARQNRLTAPAQLSDGDVVRIGSLRAHGSTWRGRSPTTETVLDRDSEALPP